MGKIATAIWIFALYIIQNVFLHIVSINGSLPDLLLAFLVVYAFMKRRFTTVAYVTIICAILNGAGTGRVFPVVTMLTGFAGMVSYTACGYMRFIPEIVRIQAVGLIMAFIIAVCEFFFTHHTLTGMAVLGYALPDAIYTVVAISIIYLIVKKTSFKNEDKQLLMIEEREYRNE